MEHIQNVKGGTAMQVLIELHDTLQPVENVISACGKEYQSPIEEMSEIVVEQGYGSSYTPSNPSTPSVTPGTDGTGGDLPWG